MELQLATFGIWELVLILLIVVVIFGAGKLPQLGESLGKAIRNFKKGFKEKPKEIKGEARRGEDDVPRAPTRCDRRDDGAALRPSGSDLGSGPRHGFGGQSG